MFTEKNHLEDLINRNKAVTVFLMNGFQLHGTITGYDKESVLFLSDGKEQMIYKHAISTVEYYKGNR